MSNPQFEPKISAKEPLEGFKDETLKVVRGNVLFGLSCKKEVSLKNSNLNTHISSNIFGGFVTFGCQTLLQVTFFIKYYYTSFVLGMSFTEKKQHLSWKIISHSWEHSILSFFALVHIYPQRSNCSCRTLLVCKNY